MDKKVLDIRHLQRYHEICRGYGGYSVEPVDSDVCGDYFKVDDVILFLQSLGYIVRSEENNWEFINND